MKDGEIMYICIKSDSKHFVTNQLISIRNQLTGFYARATMTWYESTLLTHIFQISLLLISYVLLDFWSFLISLQKYKIPVVINGDSLPVMTWNGLITQNNNLLSPFSFWNIPPILFGIADSCSAYGSVLRALPVV